MEELKIRIKTLTPLWTGGLDGTMDRIHETGLIGSLRWWYEAIVRGLGGNACDPSEHSCELSGSRLLAYENARRQGKNWWLALKEAGICDACKIFGTTGWKRRFQLEIHPIEGEFDPTKGIFPSGRVHAKGQRDYRTGGWLLHGGYHGIVELRFRGPEEVLWCEILPIMLFVERWGALGPKTSLGYGVFEILSINGWKKEPGQCWQEFLQNESGNVLNLQECPRLVGQWWWSGQVSNRVYQGILPALTNMFFSKVQFSPEENWWKEIPELRWLNEKSIPSDEAIWTGSKPGLSGAYKISNPIPLKTIQNWIEHYHIFPLTPILRTSLRYGKGSVCNGNGETDWCKFVFGTIRGRELVCGYCGSHVRGDRNDSRRWWCNTGRVSLDNSAIIRDAKRIKSKIHISWMYQMNEGEWEIRIWGWLPKDLHQNRHNRRREDFLLSLRSALGIEGDNPRQWHIAKEGQLWQTIGISNPEICWFEKKTDESPAEYLRSLLEGCPDETKGGHDET